MTRRAFREPIASARPGAALAMVALATGTLAVTGQIDPWALAAATVALLVAARFREQPRGWQRSAWVLNGGLAAVVGLSVALWARGELAAVALAHFAVLAQSLQLLDARPRRSEFLLVALSLFQVILAANLTDSAVFPILLVAFTVATVWTLLVHTLRAEALEAGQPEEASRALTGGLRRTITIASLACVALAILLFPLLPRLRGGAFLAGGIGPGLAVSGFSDRVELGDLGRIRFDPQIALRVETVEGADPGPEDRYLRGLAFDEFDGRRWSVTPPTRNRVPGDPEIGVALSGPKRGVRLVQRVVRERIDSGVLFSTGSPVAIRGPLGRLEQDASGALYAHHTAGSRVDYAVESRTLQEPPAATERALPPGEGRTHLDLPRLSPGVSALARGVTAHVENDRQKAEALERFLRERGRYSDSPPRTDPSDPRSPVEVFLEGGMAGHCEYFATAMAVLARSVGLPARIVNGFAGGEENILGGFVEYAQSDAHAWVEIHFERSGWVRYDPTPPDLRLAGAAALRGQRGLAQLASAVELWWFRNVVDFDRGRQMNALRSLWRTWHDWRGRTGENRRRTPSRLEEPAPFSLPPLPLWLGGASALAGAVAVLLGLRARRGTTSLPPFYDEALRLLAARGLVRAPAATARGFAAEAARVLPSRGAAAFGALTEAYLQQRFSHRPAQSAREALRALRESLRA
jgi:transglutaminase-like putative cysteine protease